MDENPLDKSPGENQPPSGSKTEVGDIHIDGSVGGPFVVGNNNVINLTAEQQVFRSLHQLPQPPADFTGREELIAQLLADFEKGKGAAITGQPIHGLVGMGGIGKTALGLVVAHEIKKDYPDAQIFLDLKGTTTPLSATDVMRHVILSFEPAMDLRSLNEANISAAYQSVLDGKHALLFLDNARSAEQVAPLRPPETCALLVTSRWTFSMPGLRTRRVDLMSAESAQTFLRELCPRIGDQADDLAKACVYLPLVLRIAGSFLQVNDDWSVEKYLTQLNDRKGRLATLEQSSKDAELTAEPDLLATFELSYHGLSEEDRNRWRMLSVFPSSFDVSAVGAMWDLEEDGARKLLGSLRRHSLLDYDETSSRYGLHDLLSDYALSQMKNEEEQEARLKHSTHYKDVLRAANQLYSEGGEKILAGLRLFDLEWENIRTGQAWVVDQNRNNPALLELCFNYADAGAYVLELRQHPREQIRWLEAALSAARQIGDRRYEGAALGNLGIAYFNLGEVRKAIEFYEEYLAIAREIGDRRYEGAALANLGNTYSEFGETHKAIEFYEDYLAITREIGDRHGEGTALGNLGVAYYSLGETHKAIELYEGHLAIAREIGDRRGEGRTLGNLGTAHYRLGQVHQAIEFYEQTLIIAREIGDRRGEGTALGGLGNAYDSLGETRKAIEFQEKALIIVREFGDRLGEEQVLGNLGVAYDSLGEKRKAIEHYEQCLAIAREIGDRYGEASALFNIGLAVFDLEEKERAISLVKGALETYEALESPMAEQARNTLEAWNTLQKEKGKSSWIDRIRQKLVKG
jgi:tetratricopeptide (TPR) repeat protein